MYKILYNTPIKTYVADTLTDLQNINYADFGNKAVVLQEEGSIYMLGSDRNWYCISDGAKDPVECTVESTIWENIGE